MTKDKDFKRLIRARMDKTGESFTAARANLLADSALPLPDDYEALAGMSDAAVARATGRDWVEWTSLLDRARAAGWEHPVIARHLHEAHGLAQWWSQAITVAYERFRGLRDVGQRRGGGYDANKSRTVAAPLDTLWHAFEDGATRASWLPEDITIRSANKPRSMRIRLADDSPLDVYFTAKGEEKTTVSLQQRDLPDNEAAERMKVYWGERLDALQAAVPRPDA